jgi:hypothetical protein
MLALDTEVLVDVLRGHEPALEWLATLKRTRIFIPGPVALQLIEGASDARALSDVRTKVARLDLRWPERKTCEEALNLFPGFRRRHGLDGLDLLIGLTTRQVGGTLATFRVRQFRAVPDLDLLETPYIP